MLQAKMLLIFLTLALIPSVFSCCVKNNVPYVYLKQGIASGKVLNSTEGKEFYAYLGIPYGKIPRRFDRPVPAGKWNGVLNATVDGQICKQIANIFSTAVIGAEDCLFINVYTPKCTTLKKKKLPVMVYIHGGGFAIGSSVSTDIKPYNMMNKEIVFVAFNYRLAGAGFLSTGDTVVPGNNGLMDQLLALQWIQQNIKWFGGDSNKVMLFGTSAGAASVVLHMLSPLSKGLFHAAAVSSGSAICPWTIKENPLYFAKRIGEHFQCPTTTTTQLVQCLRTVDIDEFIYQSTFIAPGSLSSVVSPVVENPINGLFLKQSPLTLLREGKVNKVPFISGVNADEGALLMIAMSFSQWLPQLNENSSDEEWLIAVSNMLATAYPNSLTTADINSIKNEYFQGTDFSNLFDVMKHGMKVSSDGPFKSCNDETLRLLSAAGVPTYMYVLDQIPASVSSSQLSGRVDVIHGAEILYFFNSTIGGVYIPDTWTPGDIAISKNMIDMWTNLAYYGNPTPNGQPVQWNPTGLDNMHYLNITPQPSMVNSGYLPAQMQFWRNILYP